MAETITFSATESSETITVTLNEQARGPSGGAGSDASVTNVNVVSAIEDDPEAVRDAAQAQALENWVCVGDSWTAATAQGNDRETYPFYLQKLIQQRGVNIYNVGVSGRRAETMLSSFGSIVAPYLTATTGLPSTVFVLGGINDGADRTPAQILGYLQGIWAAARAAGAMVVAMTLPDRDAVGGLSEANWKTLNGLIIADSANYDFLVRLDIIFNNAQSSEYTDQLHINTAAHKKLAGQVLGVLNGRDVYPSLPTDVSCNICSTTALSAATTRRLPFTEVYDANADAIAETISGDTNVRVVTVPVDGTYEVAASVIFGAIVAGDLAYLSIYIIPLATGTAVEHRLGGSFNHAGGVNMGSGGQKRFRLLRGDKVFVGAIGTKAGMTILSNTNFSTFEVRLLSIP